MSRVRMAVVAAGAFALVAPLVTTGAAAAAPHYSRPPTVQVGYTDSRTPDTAHDAADADIPLGSWRNQKGVKHTSRVYATFDLSSYAGKNVTAGLLSFEERSATDCTRRAIEVWETDPVAATPTWRTAPEERRLLDEVTTAGTCPGFFSFDVSAAVTAAAGTVTFELRVPEEFEDDIRYGRTIRWWPGISLSVTYNEAPVIRPEYLRQGGFACDESTPPRTLALWPGALQALASDADENDTFAIDYEFAVWPQDDPAARLTLVDDDAATIHAGAVGFPAGYLTDGRAYSWQARATDGVGTSAWAPTCSFVADTARPPTPTVSATDDAVFTFSGNGDPDIAGFYYTWSEPSVNGCDYGQYGLYACREPFSGQTEVRADVPGGSVTMHLPPPNGWGTLKVRAIDEAGQTSALVRYEFDPEG
jgi:hypothetical protein